ncbi:MAG: UDP-2,4-diacetamido-2,4,6-trideoxy-beta-L-altropyranose hydrolase [Lachnospiraceae bacterium]|nr:UDP-2,4-diacetamido-2,4,6-trideoxy-beta-L-altropyranose hydrolase [Lachnospiraceae bacterium]
MIWIRADADEKTGAGHIMRMLTLSFALKTQSGLTFLCRGKKALNMVSEAGFPVKDLSGLTCGPFSEEEASFLLSSFGFGKEDTLLIDSYLVNEKYLSRFSGVLRTAVMDDECALPLPCDLLINYNFYADEEEYRLLYKDRHPLPRLILGPRYMPLRKEFFRSAPLKDSPVTDLLLSVGGSDEHDLTSDFLNMLREVPALSGIRIHAVAGPLNPNYDTLVGNFGDDPRILLHHNVKDMASLMKECDLALSAGGTTLNELCAAGVPTVCFALARNQIRPCRALSEKGAALYAGELLFGEGSFEASKKALLSGSGELLSTLASSFEKRKALSETASLSVSPDGARELSSILAGSPCLPEDTF